MKRRPLGVGIVGCGEVTVMWHLPALRHVRDLELVAVADIDEAASRRVADLAGLDRGHRDHHALLADPRVEIVAVCVPASGHVEVAVTALRSGRHILVEKPPALGLAEWDELLVTERHAGQMALLGTNMRRLPAVRGARAAIAAGRLGDVRRIETALTGDSSAKRASAPWRAERLIGGGALVERAVHHIDLWRYLVESEVDSVSAQAAPDDLDVTLTATMADGTTVSTVASDQAAHANTLAIIGTDRRLDVAVDQASGVVDRIRAHRTGGAYLGTFVTQWSDLAHAIRTGEAPQPSLASGRPLLQVLLAAAQSASTGSPVRRVDAPARLVQ